MTEILDRLRSDDAKLNIMPYRDSSRTGLRGNWSKLFSGLALLMLGGAVRELSARGILGESFFIGLGIFAGLTLVCLIGWGSSETAKASSVLLIALGVIVAIALCVLLYVFTSEEDFLDVLSGGGTMFLVDFILAGNVLTSWWPPYGRRTRNLGED